LIFEDIKTDASVAINVRMVDFCGEVDLKKEKKGNEQKYSSRKHRADAAKT